MSVNFKKCPKDIDVIIEHNRLSDEFEELKYKFFEDLSTIKVNLFEYNEPLPDDSIPKLDCTILKIRDLEKKIIDIRTSIVPIVSILNLDNETNVLFKEYPKKGYINKEQLDSLYNYCCLKLNVSVFDRNITNENISEHVSENNFGFIDFLKAFTILKEKIDFDKEVILYEIY